MWKASDGGVKVLQCQYGEQALAHLDSAFSAADADIAQRMALRPEIASQAVAGLSLHIGCERSETSAPAGGLSVS